MWNLIRHINICVLSYISLATKVQDPWVGEEDGAPECTPRGVDAGTYGAETITTIHCPCLILKTFISRTLSPRLAPLLNSRYVNDSSSSQLSSSFPQQQSLWLLYYYLFVRSLFLIIYLLSFLALFIPSSYFYTRCVITSKNNSLISQVRPLS